MKRTLYLSIILIILLAALCGCSAKAEFPSSEEVREIIPAEVTIPVDEYLPIIEEPRVLEDFLGDIPRTFVLDESVWEESFGESDMQFYSRIGAPDTDNDYICIYDDGSVSVSVKEYDAYYKENELSDVFFKDSQANLYLDTETWSYGFDHGALHCYFDYSYEDKLIQAFVSHKENGPAFSYKDGNIIDISYSFRRKSETITENFNAYYDKNGKLETIYYYAYSNDDSLVIRNSETTYDSNYISEDAPETAEPAETEASATADVPTETDAPAKTPKPERTGFFGKMIDEIEKDFSNIKEDIAEDFR